MVDYSPPIDNLPIFDKLVFKSADEFITQGQADKRYLRYPNAQGTENLQTTNINGVLTVNSTSNFKNQVTLNGTTGTDRQIMASFYNLTDSGGVGGNGGRLFQSGNQIVLNNFTNNAPIIIRPTDGTGTLQTVIDIDTTSVDTKRPILMNDTSVINNRSITSSFYNFYDSSVAGTLTQNGTLYNNAGNMYLQNTTNGGTINFYLNDAGGTLQTPLQLLTTGNLSNRQLTISANNNLQMNAGTGRINQSTSSGDVSTRNTFKLSEFVYNSNNASGGATAFEFYDSVNGKGLFIMPNAGNGSLGDTSMSNDCVLSSRSTQNNNAITISNWNTNMKNGLRVFTTDTDNCGLTLQCGQNTGNAYTEFRMAYTRGSNTTTTTFNNIINFNPGTGTGLPNAIASTRRRLEGLGTLSFTDILNGGSGGITTSSIYTDSTLVSGNNGMYYNTNINGGSHIFSSNDNTGTNSLSLLLRHDVNNTYNRMYQELNSSWSNVNGYYELAKDTFPTPNPRTSGASAVSTWTTRTNSVDNNWYSVCWSPDLQLFVAVAGVSTGTTNRAMTSSNGITWTTRTTPNLPYTCVIWASELNIFVATANPGTANTSNIVISSNGTTWTDQTTPNSDYTAVCWSPELSLLVAVANGGSASRVSTSPNGTDWTARTPATANGWQSVCWSAELGLFVAVSNTGTGDRIMTSTNGTSWTSRTSPADNDWESVCWSPDLGLFVAVSSSGTSRVMTSSNGINWTLRTVTSNNWRDVCWSSELKLFVATADSGTNNRIMSSLNGINWTTRTTNSNDWWGICWSPELGIFVGCSITGTGTRIMTSSLQGRQPTSYNVFKNTFNTISETGNWNLTANQINADSLEIKQLSSNTNTLLEVAFSGTTNTYLRAKPNTGNANLHLHVVDGTTDMEVMDLNSSRIRVRRPFEFNYSTSPSNLSQLGFTITQTIASVNQGSSVNIRNITTYTFANAGTYLINWGVYATMNSGTATFTDLQFGIANSAINTFNTFTQTYTSYMDLKKMYPTLTTGENIYMPTSCIYRANAGALAYFNYLANYTGGTNLIAGGYYTIARIG